MATALLFCRRTRCLPPVALSPPLLAQTLRYYYTTVKSKTATQPKEARHHYPPPRPHEFSKPSEFVGSWTPVSDPRQALSRLDKFHRDYRKQMKKVRAEYLYEMELLRVEKQRKDDARREAIRLANVERKKAKAAVAETRAAERKVFEEEFRQTLLKEREQKLESWRAKEKLREEKKADDRELLRRQSSEWISEGRLERAILEAVANTSAL